MATRVASLPAAGALGALVTRSLAVARLLRAVHPRRLARFVRHLELAARCLRDVGAGRYRVPWKTASALAAALAYVVAPLDSIPDAVPLIGYLDDAAVLGLVLGAAESDLREYCRARGLDPADYF